MKCKYWWNMTVTLHFAYCTAYRLIACLVPVSFLFFCYHSFLFFVPYLIFSICYLFFHSSLFSSVSHLFYLSLLFTNLYIHTHLHFPFPLGTTWSKWRSMILKACVTETASIGTFRTYSPLPCTTVQWLHSISLHFTSFFSSALHCTVLHCIALHCIAMDINFYTYKFQMLVRVPERTWHVPRLVIEV